MVFKIILLPEAVQDIDESIIWYEEQRTGLGNSFLKNTNETLRQILRNPFQFPSSEKNYRKAILKTFPFTIFYKIEGSEIIIVAVFHWKRNPNIWKTRMK